jgi:hypothetical protein
LVQAASIDAWMQARRWGVKGSEVSACPALVPVPAVALAVPEVAAVAAATAVVAVVQPVVAAADNGRVNCGCNSSSAPYAAPVSFWTRRTLDRGARADSAKWGSRASWLAGTGSEVG